MLTKPIPVPVFSGYPSWGTQPRNFLRWESARSQLQQKAADIETHCLSLRISRDLMQHFRNSQQMKPILGSLMMRMWSPLFMLPWHFYEVWHWFQIACGTLNSMCHGEKLRVFWIHCRDRVQAIEYRCVKSFYLRTTFCETKFGVSSTILRSFSVILFLMSTNDLWSCPV